MRRDRETPTPEAAAEYERTHTPAHHDDTRDAADYIPATANHDPDWWRTHVLRLVELDRLRAEQTRSWR